MRYEQTKINVRNNGTILTEDNEVLTLSDFAQSQVQHAGTYVTDFRTCNNKVTEFTSIKNGEEF